MFWACVAELARDGPRLRVRRASREQFSYISSPTPSVPPRGPMASEMAISLASSRGVSLGRNHTWWRAPLPPSRSAARTGTPVKTSLERGGASTSPYPAHNAFKAPHPAVETTCVRNIRASASPPPSTPTRHRRSAGRRVCAAPLLFEGFLSPLTPPPTRLPTNTCAPHPLPLPLLLFIPRRASAARRCWARRGMEAGLERAALRPLASPLTRPK